MIPRGLFSKAINTHESDQEIEYIASQMTPEPKFRLEKGFWLCEAEHWFTRKVKVVGKGQYKKDALRDYDAGVFIERNRWGE